MRYFLYFLFLVTTLSSFTVCAKTVISKDKLPVKTLQNLSKKYPDAVDITAEQKKYFGQDLYQVYFRENKDDKEVKIRLYRTNGNFFVDATHVAATKNSTLMPTTAFDNLKASFNEYDLKDVVLIVNPNGPGEEFDLLVNSGGKDWRVTIDKRGAIALKEQEK